MADSRMQRETRPSVLLKSIDRNIAVVVKISNNSRFKLQKISGSLISGNVAQHSEENILPGISDCSMYVKKAYALCGVVCVLVYELDTDPSCRLAILFSVPYNRTLYDQTFALHITQSVESAEKFYKKMYYDWQQLDNYTRAQGDLVQYVRTVSHNGVNVTGTMTPDDRSVFSINIEDAP